MIMKKLLFSVALAFAASALFAQVQVNPQVGLALMNFSKAETGSDFSAKVGVSVGADVRIGERVQFIQGVHYLSATTALQIRWKCDNGC